MDNIFEKQKSIFEKLLSLSNKLQIIGNKASSADGMTVRQWLLTAAIAQFGDKPPTISSVSELTGSSRQNVKQLAVKLQRKGFIQIESDEHDLRVIKLKLTEKCFLFWGKQEAEFKSLLKELFMHLSEEEINLLYECINMLYDEVLKKEKMF